MARKKATEAELRQAMGELARNLVSAADEYMRILAELGAGEERFAEVRRRAYALSLTLAQQAAALAVVAPRIAELPEEMRPPLGAPLLLAALQGSCTLIAAAPAVEKLSDAVLAGVAEVDLLADGGPLEGWVRRALAVRV